MFAVDSLPQQQGCRFTRAYYVLYLTADHLVAVADDRAADAGALDARAASRAHAALAPVARRDAKARLGRS